MRVLIVYATTEGHTRDLARFLVRTLTDEGHEVVSEEAPNDERHPNLSSYDAVFVVGSLHVGRYQSKLIRFARAHHQQLNSMPSAFVSVSLSAAGHNPDDWAGLDECLAAFAHETSWSPKAVHQAAGAIRYSRYDFFKRLLIKHIVAQRGEKTTTSRDYDMTDYDALAGFCRDFLARAAASAKGAAAPGA